MWLSWLVVKSGLVNLVTPVFGRKYKRSTLEVVSELTSNRDLRSLFCYCWGDHGLEPSRAPFLAQAMVSNHFARQGAWYPVGGASEFAYNMVPIVERHGGKVLVSRRRDYCDQSCRNHEKCDFRSRSRSGNLF